VLRLSLHGKDAVEAGMQTTALLILAGMLLEVRVRVRVCSG
jgi:hypothetical protein